MAPMTASGQKDKRSINLPIEFWDDIDAIAAQTGNTPAEVTRQCVELGLVEKKKQLSESLRFENAKLVNAKLRQRQADVSALAAKLRTAKGAALTALLDQLEQALGTDATDTSKGEG